MCCCLDGSYLAKIGKKLLICYFFCIFVAEIIKYFYSVRIKSEYRVHQIAGENVVILQGRGNSDMTQIITLNDSALLLWNQLEGKDFAIEDAANVLCESYEVAESVATNDAQAWVKRMQECGLIEN